MRNKEHYRYHDLATFNGERARGIVHTEEWVQRMSAEKRQFDREQIAEAEAKGWKIVYSRSV